MHKRKIYWLLLCAVAFLASDCADSFAGAEQASSPGGTVSGRILIKGGGPLSWGQVLFYRVSAGPPPDPDKYHRTPDISRNLDGEGRFTANLPAGKYYLGAMKRASDDRLGTPREGDFVLRSVDEKGLPNVYDVKANASLDIGVIAEAVQIKTKGSPKRASATAIEGVVSDMDGKPIEDAVVIAFADPKGKSLFLSDPTGKEGAYSLRVTAGTYYLRVRSRSALGPPEPGQIVGFYGDGSLTSLQVKDGEVLKGVNFTVVLFGGRGPRAGGSGK